jgi:hypothetical protein
MMGDVRSGQLVAWKNRETGLPDEDNFKHPLAGLAIHCSVTNFQLFVQLRLRRLADHDDGKLKSRFDIIRSEVV